MCLHFLYNFCLKHFSFKKNSARYCYMYKRRQVKYPLLLWDDNETRISSTELEKKHRISNSMKIRPLKADCSMRTDGETDRDESNSYFSQFCGQASNPNLVTLKILPFCTYTLASAVLIFLEASLQVRLRYGRECRCFVVLNFFWGHKTTSFWAQSCVLGWPEVAWSEVSRIRWLGDGLDLVHQKLLHCDPGVTAPFRTHAPH